MAGGGNKESGLTDSILEVPTFVIALVLLFFLLCSLVFERCVEWLKRKFRQKGRLGLVEALQKLVMELTLLGFISLLLTTFQGNLQHMCVNYSSSLVRWTLLENIGGCPCCLKATQGISACAQIAHDCYYNSTTGSPYCGCNTDNPDALDDCVNYGTMELQHYVDQVQPSLEVFSFVVHNAYPDITVEQVCDDFCEIVNATFANFSDSGVGLMGSAAHRQLLSDGSGAGLGVLRGSAHPGQLLGSYSAWEANPEGGSWTGSGTPNLVGAPRRLQEGGDDDFMGYVTGLADPSSNQSDTETHFIPETTTFRCTGPFLAGSCPEGQVPAISYSALHQIHLLIFLIAIFHVIVSILMIILGGYRLRQWRMWQVESVQSEHLSEATGSPQHPHLSPLSSFRSTAPPAELQLSQQPSSPASAAVVVVAVPPAAGGGAAAGPDGGEAGGLGGDTPTSRQEATEGKSSLLDSAEGGGPPSSPGASSRSGDPQQQGKDVERGQAAWVGAGEAGALLSPSPPSALAPHSSAGGGVEDGAELGGDAAHTAAAVQQPGQLRVQNGPQSAATLQNLHRKWGRRSTMLRRKREYWAEAGTWILQAFMPNLVRRHQFLIIRSTYIANGEVEEPFDFVSHCLDCLERDSASVVGISLEMWVVVVLWVLLIGLSDWTSLLFIWGAAALLLLVNILLVGMLRYACRGSQPMLPSSSSDDRRLLRWLKAELLLVPIRMVLFLCSLVYSSTVFLAWQFGGSSCFFTSELDVWTTGGVNVPWWSSLILCSVLLLWVSLVTIPAYSLAVHATRSRTRQEDAQQGQSPSFLHKLRLRQQSTMLRHQAEVDALHAQVLRLQKLLSMGGAAA